jgi:PadR family transcriptional regulator PadR
MESSRAPRMTVQTQAVLRALLDDPLAARYGSDIADQAGFATGTIYPILARLEREAGWLESFWEDAALALGEGRPRRRYYRLRPDGVEPARLALAGAYQARSATRRGAPRIGQAGAGA